MSAVGKLDDGDFDENGQLVETPYRPSAAERKAAAARKPAPTQDLHKPVVQPPMPAPLLA